MIYHIMIFTFTIFLTSILTIHAIPLWQLRILILSNLLGIFYSFKKAKDLNKLKTDKLGIYVLLSIIGACSTYFINQLLQIGTVLASSFVGCLAWLLIDQWYRAKFYQDKPYQKDHLPYALAVYTGTFVGMISRDRLGDHDLLNLVIVGVIGGVAGVIFSFSTNVFEGVGGKLGTIAMISCSLVVLLMLILKP